jgi:predicted Rossmann fold nucleotide-binding protein DprA/Smf involved in DNA uptake
MNLADMLYIIEVQGLPHPIIRSFVTHRAGNRAELSRIFPADASTRQHLLGEFIQFGLKPSTRLNWPRNARIQFLSGKLDCCGVRLTWKGESDYLKCMDVLEDSRRPEWYWTAGPVLAMNNFRIGFVGSRDTSREFLGSTYSLARQISSEGVPVVSGGASGADTAAHTGARCSHGGTIMVPASGILNRVQPGIGPVGFRDTVVAIDRPGVSFSAGLAIRRNYIIAALSDQLVLVAAGMKGGSCYAVNEALKLGKPVWCFEDGKNTPPGNRHLLNAGLARPLVLHQSAEHLVGQILDRQNETSRRNGPGKDHLDQPRMF